MGNEKGRKRLDSINVIFREKSPKWTQLPFQFQFCHKTFSSAHLSSAIRASNVSIQCIQTHKKIRVKLFLKSSWGFGRSFGGKTFQDLLGHNDVREDQTQCGQQPFEQSAYFHSSQFLQIRESYLLRSNATADHLSSFNVGKFGKNVSTLSSWLRQNHMRRLFSFTFHSHLWKL